MGVRAAPAIGLCAAIAFAGAPIHAQAPTASAAAERAPDKFVVEAYDVAGVTKLTADEVAGAVYPYSGPDRTQDDVEHARKAIQDAYAAKGYEAVVVDLPVQPQELFARGIVQIAVSEAPVGQVRIVGSKYHALSVARREIPSLVPGQPVDLKALQADVSAANHFPDRTISPSFRVGAVPGTVDVELKVDDERPFHASIEVNNDHSPSTEPLRLTASLRYTNLWQAGHTASFTYVVAPQRRSDTEVYAGSYTIPFIGTPWTIAISGYKSNSNISALGGSSVLGNGYQVGARVIYRLPGDRIQQTVSLGADYKDFKQNISIGPIQASRAPIRYVPLDATYALAGATDRTSYGASIDVTAGLRAIKRTICDPTQTDGTCKPIDQFRNREQFSNENFVHANVTLQYALSFKDDVVASAKLGGQIADSHLVTNEQFAAGGMLSVRGYLQSEAVGDDGATGQFELRSPSFASHFGKAVTDARLYAFADAGFIHVLSGLPEQKTDFTLVGAGAGARVSLFDRLTGEVLVGVPLKSGPFSRAGDPRVTFVARGEF